MFQRIVRLMTIGALVAALGCGDDGTTTQPPMGGATSVTLGASMDAALYEDAIGQWANGAGNHMFAGVTRDITNGGQSGEPAEKRRALIGFNIAGAGIPAGSTIDSVFLTLNMSRIQPAATMIAVHRVSATWSEGPSAPINANEGGGTASLTGDVTWVHRVYDTVMWTTPGGDFNATASATIPLSTTGKYTWGSTAMMVADVQGWLDTPATNFGWILVGDESTDATATRFDTRTNNVPASRPQLVVYYTAP